MKFTAEELFAIQKSMFESKNCLPKDPEGLKKWTEGAMAWATLWARDEYESEQEIRDYLQEEIFEEKYSDFAPQIVWDDTLPEEQQKEHLKHLHQKYEEWTNCKYQLIKNDFTKKLEEQFPKEQYWYLDCGEWGYAIINFEGDQWRANVSNDAEIIDASLDAVCEKSFESLINGLDDSIQDMQDRINRNNEKIAQHNELLKMLTMCVNNDTADLHRLQTLREKRTSESLTEALNRNLK